MELSFGRYVPLVSGGCPIGLQILCSKLTLHLVHVLLIVCSVCMCVCTLHLCQV